MIYLDKKVWQENIKGWHIVDCAVREQTLVYLCLRENVPHEKASLMWDHDILSQLFVLNLAKPGTSFGSRKLTGYNKPRLGVARKPLAQGLLVARNNDGQVSVMGGGKPFNDEFIDPGKVPMTARVKCINDYAYSVGGGRAIYKREEIGKWIKIDAGFPAVEANTAQGFNDMDAFSETDMYAVGGHGDVWHFDGKTWTQQGFPSNVQLATVTCAGDGHVYISGEGGSLWRGQLSTWEPIYRGGSSILWNDVLWFDGKLWLASDYQLRIWDGKALVNATYDGTPDGRQVPIYGHMDAYDGLLVVASPEVVMAHDGREWRTLIAPYLD